MGAGWAYAYFEHIKNAYAFSLFHYLLNSQTLMYKVRTRCKLFFHFEFTPCPIIRVQTGLNDILSVFVPWHIVCHLKDD
jgi:hypothetical protein